MLKTKLKLTEILAEANSYLKAGNSKITTIAEIMEMDINYDQWSSLELKIENINK